MNEPRTDLDRKIERFERYRAADPENAQLLVRLGDLYQEAECYEQALQCYEQCIERGAMEEACRSRVASVYLARGEYARAEQVLGELLETAEDGRAVLLHNLGLALFYQRRWAEARARFTQAAESGLDAPANDAHLAFALHHEGEMDRAIEACERWLERAGTPQAKGYLCLLEFDNGNMTRASALAREVLDADQANTDAGVVLGTAELERQEVDKALGRFRDICRREPDNGRAWLGLGLAELHGQRHPQAIEALERAHACMPNNAGTLVALGWARLTSDDLPGAEQAFRKAVDCSRSFAEAHGGLAVALLMRGKEDEAREAARRARRLDPAGFSGRYADAILLKQQGGEAEAVRRVAEVLQQPPRPGAPTLVDSLRRFIASKTES